MCDSRRFSLDLLEVDSRRFSLPMSDLDRNYEQLELIGEGKFGQVYKVVSNITGEIFAAKHIECKRASEKKRVKDEIDILEEVNHSKLIRLYEAYEDTDKVVQILEFLPGGELFERIIDCTYIALTEVDIAGFIEQLLTGLAYLHNRNIVHLDIKPENIVCQNQETFDLKLVDFGLARRIDSKRDTCVMQGTPDFVSPEVVNFEPISLSTDMWSVGVITYVLLSGLSPFLGDSNLQTFTNITTLNYTFDEDEFEPISNTAKDFINKLLVLKPKQRMSATEALLHPWIFDRNKMSQSPDCAVDTANLKRLVARLRWVKSATAIRACTRFRRGSVDESINM